MIDGASTRGLATHLSKSRRLTLTESELAAIADSVDCSIVFESSVMHGRIIEQDGEAIVRKIGLRGGPRHPEIKALLADAYNNIGVAFMNDHLWDAAIQYIDRALELEEGDNQRSILNNMLCLHRLDRVNEAVALADDLSQSTTRSSDYVLFGMVSPLAAQKLEYVGKVLEFLSLSRDSLNDQVRMRLLKVANDSFPGLQFELADFALPSEESIDIENE